MASLPAGTPLVHYPTEMLLDGVPLRFMLPRFSRPNRARGRVPVKMAASGG
jgi:hypothetical protein